MNIKEMRSQTGFSQSKFAEMFDIPVATLKDWEQGRRTPPVYVTNMIKTILEFKGLVTNEEYLIACEKRKKSVERAVAIILTATQGPDENFMKVLEKYILGKISLEEISKKVDSLEFLGV